MLNNLTTKKDIRTFSVCPENPTGRKGEGGKATLEEGSAQLAARDLGQGWKVNPYIVLKAGETAVLADISREKVLLPMDEKGEPHWSLMENYMRNCMSRKYQDYVSFKSRA